MKIASINFNFLPANKPVKRYQAAVCDTFERRTVSFGNSKPVCSYEEFEKWAQETDFLSHAADIVDQTGEILGSGFEGTTYTIPDNDKWVIKEYKRTKMIPIHSDKPTIIKINDQSPELNIGQPIASVRLPINEAYSRTMLILKRQHGKSYGVPYSDRHVINQRNIKLHLESLKMLASFPKESYEQIVKDVVKANEAGYRFDYINPHNIMIDEENKRVNFVDVNDSNSEPNTIQLSDILYALLDGSFAINFNKSDASKFDKMQATKSSMEIVYKFQEAIKSCGLRFDKSTEYQMLSASLLK